MTVTKVDRALAVARLAAIAYFVTALAFTPFFGFLPSLGILLIGVIGAAMTAGCAWMTHEAWRDAKKEDAIDLLIIAGVMLTVGIVVAIGTIGCMIGVATS